MWGGGGSRVDISNNVEVVVSIISFLSEKRMVDDSLLSQKDDEDIYIPSEKKLSCCLVEKIVAYIGGFVCFKLKKSFHCETCANALIDLTISSLFIHWLH